MASESEARNLPPSERKLKKAREKGRVASSADFVLAATFCAGLVYLALVGSRAVGLFESLLRYAAQQAGSPGPKDLAPAFYGLLSSIAELGLPLLVTTGLAVLAGHAIHKKGLAVSIHPILPDASRLNPAEGFKRIGSFRNFVEFLVALGRIALWLLAAGVTLWLLLPDLVRLPVCGYACLVGFGWYVITRIVLLAVIFIVASGLIDIPLQNFLFLREQRMSRSEAKREQKEDSGAPELVRARREQHREMATVPGTGITLVITSSNEVVAVRYDPVNQPIPIVVAKGAGRAGDNILKAAAASGAAIEVDPPLARSLYSTGLGGEVPERAFSAVAVALVRHGKAG